MWTFNCANIYLWFIPVLDLSTCLIFYWKFIFLYLLFAVVMLAPCDRTFDLAKKIWDLSTEAYSSSSTSTECTC